MPFLPLSRTTFNAILPMSLGIVASLFLSNCSNEKEVAVEKKITTQHITPLIPITDNIGTITGDIGDLNGWIHPTVPFYSGILIANDTAGLYFIDMQGDVLDHVEGHFNSQINIAYTDHLDFKFTSLISSIDAELGITRYFTIDPETRKFNEIDVQFKTDGNQANPSKFYCNKTRRSIYIQQSLDGITPSLYKISPQTNSNTIIATSIDVDDMTLFHLCNRNTQSFQAEYAEFQDHGNFAYSILNDGPLAALAPKDDATQSLIKSLSGKLVFTARPANVSVENYFQFTDFDIFSAPVKVKHAAVLQGNFGEIYAEGVIVMVDQQSSDLKIAPLSAVMRYLHDTAPSKPVFQRDYFKIEPVDTQDTSLIITKELDLSDKIDPSTPTGEKESDTNEWHDVGPKAPPATTPDQE